MPKHILFVCKSCKLSTNEKPDQEQLDGSNLLNHLLTVHQDWSRQAELEIQTVGCLWACSYPCVVAFSSANKSTYLFTDLPPLESTATLFQFGEFYLDSPDGDIPWSKFPEMLKSGVLARIPPVPQG